MKKLNNKGFLMAETIVASSFVLTVLVVLFVQFRTSINSYNRTYNYNKPENVSSLGVIKEYLKSTNYNFRTSLGDNIYISIIDPNDTTKCTSSLNTNNCEEIIKAAGLQRLILTKSDITSLRNDLNQNLSRPGISENMRDFIRNTDSIPSTGESNYYRLIGEFKDSDKNMSNNPISTITFYYN